MDTYKKTNLFVLLLKQLRVKQWSKNSLIFAALIFSIQTFSFSDLLHAVYGFFLFSFISGCVYILNDYVDREADKNHPEKCNRPMASGELNPKLAVSVGILLFLFSFICSYFLNPLFTLVLAVYFLLNVAYSFKLKHVVIIDVMIIASGFVLRAISGGLVIHVPFTPWFLMCTMLLALFLAIGKRRHELYLLQQNKGSHRKVLEKYSSDLIDQMMTIVCAATIISYSLFTFTSGHSVHLMWTIPFVIYGIFRYLYLVHVEGKGGKPEKLLFEDLHIFYTVAFYVVSVVVILSNF